MSAVRPVLCGLKIDLGAVRPRTSLRGLKILSAPTSWDKILKKRNNKIFRRDWVSEQILLAHLKSILKLWYFPNKVIKKSKISSSAIVIDSYNR